MGAAGLISRTHYAALGSAWSYVAATAESATAPGQLDLATALAMGMPASSCAPLTGLVGGPQVMHSPGPSIYNRLFRARGDPTSYLPIITRSLQRTLPLIERIGAIGLSVTMPLKGEALRFCQPDAIAREVGAVNSLRSRSGWQGTNTDVEGIRAPLVPLCATLALRRAVILGAGGAARAAAIACQRLGLGLEVCARRLEVVREFGASGQPIAWDDRTRVLPLRDAVLINVTPITGSDTPWPDEAALDAPVVFDTAIGSGRSRLLERARAAGAVTLDPLQMWLAQGAAQLSWFLDEPITVTDLELLAS
jgi:shikimate dehydrogenase